MNGQPKAANRRGGRQPRPCQHTKNGRPCTACLLQRERSRQSNQAKNRQLHRIGSLLLDCPVSRHTSQQPVIDAVTELVAALLRSATVAGRRSGSVHGRGLRCPCGAVTSDLIFEIGTRHKLTALCVHVVAYHRGQLDKFKFDELHNICKEHERYRGLRPVTPSALELLPPQRLLDLAVTKDELNSLFD